MDRLKKHKRKMMAILLICLITASEGILGARFFHGEMDRQIDETLKAQALQIVNGYNIYDQNREIRMAGMQADALELNRIHGDFIYNALVQAHKEHIGGDLDESLIEGRVREILKNSEDVFRLKSVFIPNASTHRNDLDQLIKDTFGKPGYRYEYLAKTSSDLFHNGSLDIVFKGNDQLPWKSYVKAVFYEPLDMMVIFEGISGYEENSVTRLARHIQKITERTVTMTGSTEDVIIVQENGYSLYSGQFEKRGSKRVSGLTYHDLSLKDQFPGNIINLNDTYRTLQIKTHDGNMQELYCYILYDGAHHNYILVGRRTSEIAEQETPLILISRFAAFINILVVSFIACMLLSRTDLLKEEASML